MLPHIRQRLIILVAVLIGAAGWLPALGSLRIADGAEGLSIWTARVGPVAAIAVVIICGIPAAAAALFTAASGNMLAGAFSVTASLCIIAGLGGGIDGWVVRQEAALPGDYGGLIGEVLIWGAALLFVLLLIHGLRRSLGPRLALLKTTGSEADDPARPDLQSLLAGLLCALISGVLLVFTLRSIESGQVIWSLIIAFLIGALVARLVIPDGSCYPVLLSPVLVALFGYGWVLLTFDGRDDFLEAWYTLGRSASNMPGPALALPIHYVSAAVVGCTLGAGWAQGLVAARGREEAAQRGKG